MAGLVEYIAAIGDAITETRNGPATREANARAINALLCVAATIANGSSRNSVGISIGHVEESAERMLAILEETFGDPMIAEGE